MEIIFPFSLGTYYVFREPGEKAYSIMRTLDVDRRVIHYQMFNVQYDSIPPENFSVPEPLIMHIPHGVGMLLRLEDVQPVKRRALTNEDLEGYRLYLEAIADTEENRAETDERIAQIIAWSSDPDMVIRLKITKDETDNIDVEIME